MSGIDAIEKCGLPQQVYCLETGNFAVTSDDLISNIVVTRLNVTRNKIVIVCKGVRANASKPATETFATEIELMSHLVPVVRVNGKISPPPDEDILMEDWAYPKKHHVPVHKPAKSHAPH